MRILWSHFVLALTLLSCSPRSPVASEADVVIDNADALAILNADVEGADVNEQDVNEHDVALVERDTQIVTDYSADCIDDDNGFECAHTTSFVDINGELRALHLALPVGPAPANGFPLVIAFQGSGFKGELYFTSNRFMPFGGQYQGQVTRRLLEEGFAVLAPDAKVNGNLFWDTNQPSGIADWEATDDHALMLEILARVDDQRLGNLDESKLYAMGISSGGYMTSRMAISYPGRFTKLAIVSASYATCGGSLCLLPDELPEDHPPTYFFHGVADAVVPIFTARWYFEQLEEEGFETRFFEEGFAGHRWIESSVTELPRFFLAD